MANKAIAAREGVQNGFQRRFSPQSQLRADDAWKVTTDEFEKKYDPDLWITLETIKPIRREVANKIIRKFWNRICRQHNTHAVIFQFSDHQPNSYDKDKYDYHFILSWEGPSVPVEYIKKRWETLIRDHLWKTVLIEDSETISISNLCDTEYLVDIQPYLQKNTNYSYNRALRYGFKHEWIEAYVACPHKGQCKHKGCRVRNRLNLDI